jgi:4,5-DOPA dioxygenase extradiol
LRRALRHGNLPIEVNMPKRMPTVFVSHGAPSLLLERGATYEFLQSLSGLLPRPSAVVCISAHWDSARPALTGHPAPDTLHDFYGFPAALYDVRYACPGDAPLADALCTRLMQSGLETDIHPTRGLDHGAWVPLMLMYPAADIPVIQLSVQSAAGAGHHWTLGRALQPLRDQGVLILASGGATHNLREAGRYALDAPPPAYASEFDAWLNQAIQTGDEAALLDYLHAAPHAARNHPTAEHLLPLFVALGAGDAGVAGRRLHRGYTYGILSMAAFAWGL